MNAVWMPFATSALRSLISIGVNESEDVKEAVGCFSLKTIGTESRSVVLPIAIENNGSTATQENTAAAHTGG
jgi:hypothetical protein